MKFSTKLFVRWQFADRLWGPISDALMLSIISLHQISAYVAAATVILLMQF